MFKNFLVKKESEPSSFLYYIDPLTKKKTDTKIYNAILTRQTDYSEYNSHTISRLRARAGVSLEDANILLGNTI